MDREQTKTLNFLKGIAAVVIANLYHYRNTFSINTGLNYPFENLQIPGGSILRWVSCNGWLLVELFFEISGILFVFAYADRIKDGILGLKAFLKRRVLKIYPMMILSTLIMAFLGYVYYNLAGQWWLLVNIDVWHIVISVLGIPVGWFENDVSVNQPIWYISILFQCYILGYFLVYARKRWNLGRWVYLMPVLFALNVDYAKPEGIQFLWFNANTARGFAAFFIAVFLADIVKEYREKLETVRKKLLCTAYILLLLLGVVIHIYGESVLGNTRYILVFVVYPAVLVIALFSRFWKKAGGIKPFQFLGDISFEIYLWNLPTQLLTSIVAYVCKVTFPYDSIFFWVLHMAISIVIAFFFYKCVEKPIGNYLQRKL